MEQQELKQTANMLQAKFKITSSNQNILKATSPVYLLSGISLFQVKVVVIFYIQGTNNRGYSAYSSYMTAHVRFAKAHEKIKNISYQMKFSSKTFRVNDKIFISDDTWQLVYEQQQQVTNGLNFVFEFELTCHMDVPKSDWSFEALHDDAELTDFELRGEDGSVSVHKAVLAGYSPVFKTMLSGKWVMKDYVDIPGMSKEILQGFKDYMYLQKLPETDLEQILQLACYYMMTDLKNKCSALILSQLTGKNAMDMAEFAGKYINEPLFLGILKYVEMGLIKVNDIELNKIKTPVADEATSNPEK